MSIYELTADALIPAKTVTFASQKIREREDLQRILRINVEEIAPDTMVIAEEFGDWDGSWRSIDLLCLDKQANLVVIELKRTEDGGHMELQAIRYAAMISSMTFADAVNAHARFLEQLGGNPGDAEGSILSFLEWDEPKGNEFGQDVRIVLVSADFNKEITTSVLWLNERDLDIRCVRLIPHQLDGKILLDIQQVLPLPEATEYQVRLRKKAAEQRTSSGGGADWTRYDLTSYGVVYEKLYKRRLFLEVVKSLVTHGTLVSELLEFFPPRKFISLEGQVSGDEFRASIVGMTTTTGASVDVRRFYLDDDDLFYSEGRTWALSNQWSLRFMPDLDRAISKYSSSSINYKVSAS